MKTRWVVSPATKGAVLHAARELRKNPTRSEAILWEALRKRRLDGLRVRRQQPIGHYVVDFYIASIALIIEIDGSVHAQRTAADEQRQKALESLGMRFVRLEASEVETNIGDALEKIRIAAAKATVEPIVQQIIG